MDGRQTKGNECRIDVRESFGGSTHVRGHHRRHHETPISDDATFHDHQHGCELICQNVCDGGGAVRVVVHQCGLSGCRVGEASYPGPVQTRQARRLERSFPCTQVDASSDDEALVRPNRGRHVIPRTVGELPATFPASPGVLLSAGA